jgi:p-hydroxybenzoate 3-monooxygenase
MNLAVADVHVLSHALSEFYKSGSKEGLQRYSATCLRRVWRAQHFSWSMTSMLHFVNEFEHRRQLAELENVTTSRAAATNLAENYVGFPLDSAA